MKADHIGIAVRSIEERLKIWRDMLGCELIGIKEVRDQKVKVAMLKIGQMKIELLEAMDEDSPVAKFIQQKGEGLHHISVGVNGLEEILRRLKSSGVKLIDDKPRIGVSGRKIAFVHPQDMGGVLIELCED